MKKAIGIIIVTVIAALIGYYDLQHLFRFFEISDVWKNIIYGVEIIGAFLIASTMLLDVQLPKVIGKLVMFLMALYFVFFFLYLGYDVIAWIVGLFRVSFSNIPFFIVNILGLTYIVYGYIHSLTIDVKKYTIDYDITERIALISDVHLGYYNDVHKLKRIVDAILKEDVDIVLIGGDLFDGNFKALHETDKVKEQFARLTMPVYLAWGNHDAGDTYKEMKDYMLSTNIILLEDEQQVIREGLQIIGRKDIMPIGEQGGKRRDLNTYSFNETMKTIVIEHEPQKLNDFVGKADLVVCGHTHKGQVFPLGLVTKRIFEIDYGYKRKEKDTHVVVSSGISTWGPPMRIGSNNELVIIEKAK